MEYEYIVYGGFDVVLRALQAVANIFNDNNYISLFWTFAIVGLISAGLSFFIASILGRAKGGPFEWVSNYWWAIFMYFLLIIPGGTLHLYDAHKNRYQSVGGLPIGVAMIAGNLNKIEVGLKEIVETAMTPLIPYEDIGNGQSIDMMRQLYGYVQKNFYFPDNYDKQSLDRYTMDCAIFSILSGDTSFNDFLNDQDLFNNTWFATSDYINVWTVIYSDANRSGETMTCKDAYAYLKAKFTPAYFNNQVNGFCAKMGYKISSPEELTRCNEVMLNTFQQIGGYTGSDPAYIFLQMYLTQYINSMIDNPMDVAQFVAAREAATSMAGVGMIAGEFLPIFRSVMLALAFALTPLIFLFMSTFALEAFGYFLGMFIWLTVWGVTDVILCNFAEDYAFSVFESIKNGSLALTNIFSFDEYAAKVLAVMGYMKVLGVMLSSAIVFGIFKFGGDALARAAGSMQGSVEGAGKTAGNVALTAEGRSSYMSNLDRGIAGLQTQGHYSAVERQQQMLQEQATAVETANQIRGAFRGDAWKTISAMGQANAYNISTQTTAAQTKIRELGGFDNAVKMMSDAIARGDISKAKETAKMVAQAGSLKELTDSESDASASNLLRNIAETNAFYKDLATAGFGKDALDAAENYGKWVGTKDASEADAMINDGAKSAIERELGVASGSFNRYMRQAENGRIDLTDPNLQKIHQALTGGDPNVNAKEAAKAKFEAARQNLAETIGGYKGAREIGELQQTQNKMKALGLGDNLEGRRQLAKFEKDGLLSKDMAAHLNRQYGTDFFREGMKVDSWGVGDDSKAMINKASMTEAANSEHGGRSLTWENGGATIEGTYTAKQALEKANQLEKDGHRETAHGLRNMVSKQAGGTAKAGSGINDNEAISFKEFRSQDGKNATFFAKHGTETEWTDLEKRTKGSDKQDIDRDLTTVEHGTRKWFGSRIERENIDREAGVKRIINPETGKPMNVQGEWYYETRKGEDGKIHRELVAGNFRNGQTGNYLTFFKDDKGQVHYGAAEATLDKNGKWVIGEVESISEREFERNGYFVKQKTDSSGMALYTTATRGQNVKDEDTLKQDYGKMLNQNLASQTFTPGQDLTETPTFTQQAAMSGENTLTEGSHIINAVSNFDKIPGRITSRANNYSIKNPNLFPKAGKIPKIGEDMAPGTKSDLPKNHPVMEYIRKHGGKQ